MNSPTKAFVSGKAIFAKTTITKRQVHERSGADAPHRQCLPEVFVVRFQSDRGGDIEQAGKPERAVEHETTGIAQSLLGLALQELVEHRRWILEVAEEIADADTHPARCDLAVALRHGLERRAVDSVVGFIHPAVEPFPAIVRDRAAGR